MKRQRTGSLMMETTMAITLVAMALAGVSQLLLLASHQKHMVEARRLAHREAGNVLERVMPLPDGQFAETVQSIEMSEETRASLPNAKLTVERQHSDEGMNQIRVRIEWRQVNGTREQLELTAWKPMEGAP